MPKKIVQKIWFGDDYFSPATVVSPRVYLLSSLFYFVLDGVKASIWLLHMDWLGSKAFVCHGSSPVVNIGQSLNSKEI